MSAGRPALSGEGARIVGGRWNPRGSFAVLYLATTRAAVVAEFHRLADNQRLDPASFLPRTLYRYDVRLDNALDLTDSSTRDLFGVDEAAITADDRRVSQAIGEAAFAAGRSGIVAPSAAGRDIVVAVFTARLGPESTVTEEEIEIWEKVPPA